MWVVWSPNHGPSSAGAPRCLGTIWVDRKSKDSRRATRASVRNRLQEGMGIVIFPEGTTYKGPELLEYRPGMFYTCAEEGFPIVPVALEYKDPNIAWVNKEWFVPHAFHHFGAKTIDVAVRIGEAVHMTDAEALRSPCPQLDRSPVFGPAGPI